MPDYASAAGLLRSLAIYYGHPLRHLRLVRLYRPFIPPGSLVLDVGAHVGNHTRAFLALGARVVSVDPQPLTVRWLRRLFSRNGRVTLVEAALGASRGDVDLLVSRRTPTVTTISAGWAEQVGATPAFAGVRWDARLKVPQRTLDDLLAEHGAPAFIKLDVEGAEAEVLAGLSRPVPALCFEAHAAAPGPALACLERLAELGNYVYTWSVGESARLQPTWIGQAALAEVLRRLPPDSREINVFARLDAA